ncbi:MAG: PTS glucose transporter subunit IIA [Atopostipes sp.]|nr:PTS glucose transporter subunit IIA [Atopostipes sp.]
MGLFDFLKKDEETEDKNVQLYTPVDGLVKPISEVNDPVFSEKMMGDGFGVDPENGDIYSPVNARVSSVFPTKHAVGLKLSNDIDLLIHIGIDTVELEGEPFEVMVEEGQEVTPETLLVKTDLDALKEAGKENTVIIAFTNMDIVEDYSLSNTGELSHGELIGEISSKDQ